MNKSTKTKLLETSQSKQKILNYLDEFIKSDYFQNEIKVLRKKFNIPPNGFSLPEYMDKKYTEKMSLMSPFYIPDELSDEKLKIIKPITLSIKKMMSKFPINDLTIHLFFRLYLFHNKSLYGCLEEGLDELGLCRTEDIYDELDEYSFFSTDSKKIIEIMKNNFESYPVVLKLHPSITQRDLLDYIKKRWHIISFYLNQYKDKNTRLGKVKKKKKSIKERNDFIYENKHLPRKKIMELVGDKFGKYAVIDYGYISKIISLEKKRRKDV